MKKAPNENPPSSVRPVAPLVAAVQEAARARAAMAARAVAKSEKSGMPAPAGTEDSEDDADEVLPYARTPAKREYVRVVRSAVPETAAPKEPGALKGRGISQLFPHVAEVKNPYVRRLFALFVSNPAFAALPSSRFSEENIRVVDMEDGTFRFAVSDVAMASLSKDLIDQALSEATDRLSTEKWYVPVETWFSE